MKFSIGIPAFKKTYLDECIRSILSQSYTDFELIIVDDHSPEDLQSVITKFDDKRISYFRNESNIGSENVVDNWNKCLNLSKGDFFILMGDDDVLEYNYLETFNSLIQKYPELDVFHCRSKIIDSSGECIELTVSWPEFENVYDNIWHRISEKRRQYISDFVYRSDSLKMRGGFYKLPLAWGSDDITSFIACGHKGIAHSNALLFNYRSNSLSITSTGNFLLKLKANIEYRVWVKSFLENKSGIRIEDEISHNVLTRKADELLRRRNINALSGAINKNLVSNSWLLLRKRQEFEISLLDVLIIAFVNFRRRYIRLSSK